MIDIHKLKVGDRVYYQPDHYGDDRWENGIVKEIRLAPCVPYDQCLDSVWVVYNCNKDWENYWNYTSAKTNLRDLYMGWR